MIYDISRPVEPGMAVYKDRDEKQPRYEWVGVYAQNNYNESTIFTNLHTGTHMDAPLHMVEGGASVDTLDLELFVGPCRVYDLSSLDRRITRADLEPLGIKAGERVLFKTRNSFEQHFNPEFICLAEDAALYLRDIGILSLGIDAMSIERGDPDHKVHSIILGAGIGVLEDARLAEVPAGSYSILALPLLLQGREGSPCRAILEML